ncbi:MAG: PHB depolymerase family esterase [Acidobacteriota bacterium]
MDLDLSAAFNGPHTLEVEVHDEARQIGRVALRVWVQKGMTERLAALEAAAKTLPAGPRASVRYPADYISKVNRGLVEMGTFDLGRELNAAEAVASAASRAVDPFAERRGDFKRHHLLPSAGEILPYRVYVPKAYDGTRAAPLVVALHGLGATEDSFFDAYGRNLPRLAEERGYLVVAPLGYRVDGFYGSGIGAMIDPAAERTRQLSEQDVMAVLMRMREDYKVDDRRVYLLGHSMGAIGAWHLAAKYPERWAAVAAFAGTGPPASVARMKDIPQFVVHGDADPTVSVSGSRGMVAEMRKLGVDVRYIEVPGGNHIDVVVPHLDGAFDFFDTHAKGTPATRR